MPWRLAVQLLGPPATHTLLAAAVPSAAPGLSSRSSSTAAGGEREPAALLAEQAQRLQSMSLQDGQAAAGADLGAAADSRDLAMLLLRSLPPRLVLPAGQRCTALVQLQSQAAVQVDVLSVDWEAAEGAVAAAAVASATQAAAAAAAAAADTLGKGDVFTAAFSLASATSAPAELPSLGFLRLRWRRTQHRPHLVAAAARGGSRLAPAAAAAAAEAADPVSSRPGSPTAAAAAPPCEVLVPLPAASFMAPLLTAELRFPPAATAGRAAELELLLSNGGATSQEVAVAVGDPHGFLLAGEAAGLWGNALALHWACCCWASCQGRATALLEQSRARAAAPTVVDCALSSSLPSPPGPKSTTVQLLPRSAATVTWHAAPYHIGECGRKLQGPKSRSSQGQRSVAAPACLLPQLRLPPWHAAVAWMPACHRGPINSAPRCSLLQPARPAAPARHHRHLSAARPGGSHQPRLHPVCGSAAGAVGAARRPALAAL